jgi:ABC-type Fe3+ transport system substrate-binding protein
LRDLTPASSSIIEYICSQEGQKAMAEAAEFVLYPEVAPSFADANQVPQRTVFMEEPTAEEFKNLQNEMRQIFLTGK